MVGPELLVPAFMGVVAIVAVVAYVAWQGRASRRRRIARLAREIGFAPAPRAWVADDAMTGIRDGVPIRVEFFYRGSRPPVPYTRFIAAGLPKDLTLRSQGLAQDLYQSLAGPDVKTGDGAFDAHHVVHGDAAWLAAALDAGGRLAVSRFVAIHGGVVGDGEARIEMKDHRLDVASLLAGIGAVTGIVRALSFPPAAAVARLAASVRSDPAPSVRRACLRALARHRAAPDATDATRHALADRDGKVRAHAALLLGPEGDALLATLAPAELADLALEDPPRLLRALARIGGESAVLPLLDVAAAEVRVAACRALARVGTARAVEPLRALTASPLLGERAASDAARSAVASIQARLVNAGSGQVSLAGDGGELSVTGESGAVSIMKR